MIHSQTRQRRRERGIEDDLPRCSHCDRPNDRSPQRYCTGCHNTYQKNWAAEQRAQAREYRKLFNVKQYGSIET